MGKELEDGTCCCHGCLKKQKRAEKTHKQCDKTHSRTKRTIYHPQYHPMEIPCLTDKNCTCQKVPPRLVAGSNTPAAGVKRQPSENKRMLDEMKAKRKEAVSNYNKRKNETRRMKNFYQKNGKRNHQECKQKGMACFK